MQPNVLKWKLAYMEAEVDQARVERDAWNVYVAQLEARGKGFENQIVQNAPQVRVAVSKYFLPYNEDQKLKRQLVAAHLRNVKMKQRSDKASKDVLGYMNALHF